MELRAGRWCRILFVEAWERSDRIYARAFEKALRAEIKGDERAVVIDCSNLRYIGSWGLRFMDAAGRRLIAQNTRFAVYNPSGPARRTFETSSLNTIIPVRDSEEGGLRSLPVRRPKPRDERGADPTTEQRRDLDQEAKARIRRIVGRRSSGYQSTLYVGGDILFVETWERLDRTNSREFWLALRTLVKGDELAVVIDCNNLCHIGSSGV